MNHDIHQFQIMTEHGLLTVRFLLQYHGGNTTDVTDLSITPPYKPIEDRFIGVEQYNGVPTIYYRSTRKENGNEIEERNYCDDRVSKTIAKKISDIKDEQTPRFF